MLTDPDHSLRGKRLENGSAQDKANDLDKDRVYWQIVQHFTD